VIDIWYEEERMEGVSRSPIKEGLSEVLFALETLIATVFFLFLFKSSLLVLAAKRARCLIDVFFFSSCVIDILYFANINKYLIFFFIGLC
jgi:hypothetical protein